MVEANECRRRRRLYLCGAREHSQNISWVIWSGHRGRYPSFYYHDYLSWCDGRTMDTKTSSGFVLWHAPWRRRRRRGMNEWWRGGFANNLRLITVGTHNGLVHVLLLSSSRSSVISHRWMNGWSVMYRKLLLSGMRLEIVFTYTYISVINHVLIIIHIQLLSGQP